MKSVRKTQTSISSVAISLNLMFKTVCIMLIILATAVVYNLTNNVEAAAYQDAKAQKSSVIITNNANVVQDVSRIRIGSNAKYYWKIVSGDAAYTDFCIRGGGKLHTYYSTFSTSNLFAITSIPTYFKSVGNYNSAMWLIDNAYIDTVDAETKAVLKQNLINQLTDADAKTAVNALSDDELIAIQACVFWRFSININSVEDSASVVIANDQNKTNLAQELFNNLYIIADQNHNNYSHVNIDPQISKQNFSINVNTQTVGTFRSNVELNDKNITVIVNGTEHTTGFTVTGSVESGYSIGLPSGVLNTGNGVTNTVEIKYTGIKTSAYLLTHSGLQNLMAVNKSLVRASTGGSETTPVPELDLALVKTIVSYTDPNTNKTETADRFNPSTDVSTTGLDNKTTKDASYKIEKGTLKIQAGGTVTYRLYIFNEGQVDANGQIIDYLPSGLTLSNFSRDFWREAGTVAIDGKVYTKLVSANTQNIKAYSNGKISYQYKDLVCKVNSDVEAGDVLVNYAEIKAFTSAGITVDRDSSVNNINLNQYANTVNNLYGFSFLKSEYNQQDDDDFERITIVKSEFDLALRQYISAINSENIVAREPALYGTQAVDTDTYVKFLKSGSSTFDYDHSKTTLEVQKGDLITFTVRVYNEGLADDYSGYAYKITDVIPAGLTYNQTATEAANEGVEWINNIVAQQKNTTTGTTQVNIFAKTGDKYNLKNILKYYSDSILGTKSDYYQEVKIVCSVDDEIDANTRLINVAQVTQYCVDGTIIDSAEKEQVATLKDRDSTIGSTSSNQTDNADTILASAEGKLSDYTPDFQPYVPGVQDDDDFESVIVKEKIENSYKFKVKKITFEFSTAVPGALSGIGILFDDNTNAVITDAQGEAQKMYLNEQSNTEVADIPVDESWLPNEANATDAKIQVTKIQELQTSDLYAPINQPIYAYYTFDEEGNVDEIKISTTLFEGESLNQNFDDLTTYANVRTANNGTIRVDISKNNNEIIVTVPNPRITGNYQMALFKVDEANLPLEGAKFVVNGEEKITSAQGLSTVSYDLKNTGWSYDSITEVDTSEVTNGKKYVKLADDINIYHYVGIENYQYKVTQIGFGMNDGEYIDLTTVNGTSTIEKDVLLEDGNTVKISIVVIKAYDYTTIKVVIPNNPVKYKLQLLKVDTDQNPISNVTFKLNGETTSATNANGIIELSEKYLPSTGADLYTISEINVDSRYVKLADDVNVYVSYSKDKKGIRASFSSMLTTTTKEVTLENGEKVNVTLKVIEDGLDTPIVQVTIPNKDIPVNYNLKLRKLDAYTSQELTQSVTFGVQQINSQTQIDANTTISEQDVLNSKQVAVTGNAILDAKQNVERGTSYRYRITEDVVPENYVKTLLQDVILKVDVNEDGEVSAVLERYNGTTPTAITNNKNINLSVNEQNEIILEIANLRKIEYNFNIIKTDEAGQLINSDNINQGAKFDIGIDAKVLNDTLHEDNNNIVVDGSYTINRKNVIAGSTLTAKITEKQAKVGYINLLEGKYILVNYYVDSNTRQLHIEQVNNKDFCIYNSSDDTAINFADATQLYNSIQVTVNNDKSVPEISVQIPNKKIVGNYSLQLIKTGETQETKLSNVQFNVNNRVYTTNTSGIAQIVNQKAITVNNVGTQDSYEISEINLGANKYISLANSLHVYVTKAIVGEGINQKYAATGVSFASNATPQNTASVQVNLKDGTEVTINAIIENGIVKVTIPNKKIEGKYTLQIKKVSSENLNQVIGGTEFSVLDPVQLSKTVETDSVTGIATVTENREIYGTGNDIYRITETVVPNGYRKLEHFSITARVSTTLAADGNSYVPASVTLSASQTSYGEGAAEEEAMLNAGLSYEIENNVITITIPNQPTTNYKLKLQKVDADSNTTFLSNAKFTVDGAKANVITNQALTNGVFVTEAQNVNVSEQYLYKIYETEVPQGYKDVFAGTYVEVAVVIDGEGSIDQTNSYIAVRCIDTTLPITQIVKKVREVSEYVNDLSFDVANKTVIVTLKNPKITKDFSLNLVKHELNSIKTVSNAGFTLKQSTDNGQNYTNVNTFTTPVNTALASVQGAIAGNKYYYELEETTVPANYVSEFKNIQFTVDVSITGEVSANITKIYDGTQWIDYNTSAHSQYISLNIGDDNKIQISWANSVEYTFNLNKYYYSGTGSVATPATQSTFKIERVSPTEEELYNGQLNNGQCTFTENKINANSTYKYRITETATPTGFSNLITGVPVLVTIRTDSNGNIISTDSATSGSSWKPENPSGLTVAQLRAIGKMIKLQIVNNTISLNVDNYYENYYQVQIVKVDNNGRLKENAEFAITMPDGSSFDTDVSTPGVQNAVTDEEGLISLGYRDIAVNTVESYEITEIVPPAGYNILEGKVKLDVDLTGASVGADITDSDVTLTYEDENGIATTLTGLQKEVVVASGTPIIRITIPNEGKQHAFKLLKTDGNGTAIQAVEKENGFYDGAYFTINRRIISADNIVPGTKVDENIISNGVLLNGEIQANVGSYVNGQYVYTIQENSAKSGFANILDGYLLSVIVKTDTNGDVVEAVQGNTNNTRYTVTDPHTSTDVTSQFADYIDLVIETDANNESIVKLSIKNPSEYKLRMNKKSSDGNDLTTAVLKAVEVQGEIEGTNYTMQNASTLLTSARKIGVAETQTWKIYEMSTQQPYVNVLDSNYILVTVQNTENGVELVDYKIMTPEGNEVLNTNIANSYVNVEMTKEDSIDVVNVTIENPVHYNLELTKFNTNGDEIESADLEIKEGPRTYTNEGTSSISVHENIVDLGDVKAYTIKELGVDAPYVNILEGMSIRAWVRMKYDAQVEVLLFDIIDNETEETVEKSNIAYAYIGYEIVEEDGVQTVKIKIENPFTYNFKLTKKDTNGNELQGAQLRIETNGKRYTNLLMSSRAIKEKQVDIGTVTRYKVTELKAPTSHENILENKYVLMDVLMGTNGTPQVTYYKIFNSQTNEELANTDIAYSYISYDIKDESGIKTVELVVENPIKFNLNIVKTDTNGIELNGPNINIQNAMINVNTQGDANFNITERNVDIGNEYTYTITETLTVGPYVNILEGKYIKLKVLAKPDETIQITEFKIFNASNNSEIDAEDKIYTFVETQVTNTGIPTVQVKIQNPVKFKVEVEKVNGDGDALAGTDFEIESSIISNQNAEYTGSVSKEGVTQVGTDGKIKGTTTQNGVISYDETWVKEGIYEYEIKETKTPGNQYVNALEGYKIYVRVKVLSDGSIALVNKEGIEADTFYIEDEDGEEAPIELYKYVKISIDNNILKASISVEVENPVKYNVNVNKTLAGTEENMSLEGVRINISSDITGPHNLTTNVLGKASIEENAIEPGEYSYWITEVSRTTSDYVNILDDYYIKVYVEVLADGEIKILNSNGEEQAGAYYIYKSIAGTRNYRLINLDQTNIDDYLSVNVTSQNDIHTLNVNIENPQEYVIQLNKKEKDTNEKMNNVKFNMVVRDADNNIVNLKSSVNLGETINTANLVTSTYEAQDGVIRIENILVEQAGTYTITLTEQEPEGYKDSGEIKVQYEIVEGNGKYNIANVQVLQGEYYVSSATAVLDTPQKLVMNLQNEKITGSYNFEIVKESETQEKLEDIAFKINSEQNERITNAQGKITYSKQLTQTGWQYDEIEEIDSQNSANGKDYAKSEKIVVYRYIEIVDNKYVVTKVGFSDEEGFYIDVPTNGTATITEQVKTENPDKPVTVTLTASAAVDGIVTCSLNVPNPEVTGEYQLKIKKIDDTNNSVEGVTFKINGHNTLATGEDGILDLGNKQITNAGTDVYTISEVNVDNTLLKLAESVTVKVSKERIDGKFVATKAYFDDDNTCITKKAMLEDGRTEVDLTVSLENGIVLITIPNKKVKYDLALQKFITGVNDNTITNREPAFSISEGNYVYTPEFDNLAPEAVANSDVVTYTIRVYNEGTGSCYAAEIMDDIPNGLEFIPYVEGDQSINGAYKWVMYRQIENGETPAEAITREYNGITYVITNDATKAKFIRTEYLSKGAGEDRISAVGVSSTDSTENPNLLKAFNPTTMQTPDYKEVKVQFKVNYEVNSIEDTSRTIVNYAQITNDTDKNGSSINDEDSEPNVWTDGEDDQDREKIKVKYFDLALSKWVSEAIVIEDGNETKYEGNKETDIPEPVLKVDLKQSKINDVVVKFKYQIKVTNQGEIEGYVKEISDYIPQGLKFVAADNTEFGWVEKDGKIVTSYLEDTILQPDESATVTIVLTWINGEDNLGEKTNIAEISKDYNNKNDTSDIDSTPNNQILDEDDIDDAKIILTVTTGEKVVTTYIILGLSVVGLIATGTILIKKFVLVK